MPDAPTVTRIDDFGVMPDGTPVPRFLLDNGRGLRAEVIGLGGIVLRLFVPGRDGASGNVLLGPADVGQVLSGKSPYLGALVGRVGNRVGHAKFFLDGITYTLAANDGEHSLHGGKVGYDKRLWHAEPVDHADGAALRLTLIDPDGTEGYPGTMRVEVTYTLTAEGAWRIDYTATTDAQTPVNLTQHAYFNLADAGKTTILDHVARVHAKCYTPSDATLLPTGHFEPVERTPFDYRTAKPIGHDFAKLDNTPRGVDHNFVIDDADGTLRLAAEIYEPVSGRLMSVHTTEPGVQFYTGNFLNGTFVGQDGFTYAQHTGFCLETQHYPNSINVPTFPSTILKPGETLRTTTAYRFEVR